MFNVYEIGNDFDVFVAFETMNNRGKKLSNLELLKNRLIYLTTLYEADELKESEQIALRAKINDAWKEVYHQLGRNKKKPLNDDDFLIAHWIMYFQYSRQKGDDYIRFLLDEHFTPQNIYDKTEVKMSGIQTVKELREEDQEEEEDGIEMQEEITMSRSKLSPKDIEGYVNSLKTAAVHWYNSFNPINNKDLSEVESLWLDRLNRMGMAYFRPLIVASFVSNEIPLGDRIRLLEAIERFVFIIFRMRAALSSYRNSEFYRAARQLRNGSISVDAVIQLLETRMDYCFYPSEEEDEGEPIEYYFDYSYFQKFLDRKFKDNGAGFYTWNGLRYFLYEYEMEKVRERGSQKIDWELFVKSQKDKISVEHIYPQTPDDKSWKTAFKGLKQVQKNNLCGSLGNLLLLSMSINSSLQNDPFQDKKEPRFDEDGNKIREGYSNGSHSEIEVARKDTWGPEEIKQRGIDLLKFMERRWEVKFESEDAMLELLFV